MSTPGRGRGYTGRHHIRDRPGTDSADQEAARTLAELSPRELRAELKVDKMRDIEVEKEDKSKDIYLMTSDDEITLKELLTVDEQYRPLLVLLEQFSLGEDGIQFNRKLRQFESTVTTMCPDEARLQQAFSTFRAASLLNSVTGRKLAAVGASFTRQQRQQLLRGALLNVVMQGTFSKLDLLERGNPQYLINAANMMGDYFAEARLCNGNKVHILASPLLQYMKALLNSEDVRAHRSLATQLMQNGRELLSQHTAQELDELSISIRLRLLTPPTASIIWLILSADLCLNKFLPLPNTLQQFYAAHLELNPDENFSEVSYGSWKKSPEKEEYRSDISIDSGTDKVSQNLSQVSLNQDESDTKPKLRPILGAGAGLLRQEQALSVNADNFEMWSASAKTNLSKRYDLNSWRQNEEENTEEPVFNPAVLPPNYPVTVPDYPPPNIFNYDENVTNYLQQGDGTYIQNQYQTNTNFNQQGDTLPFPADRPTERVNNEIQKNAQNRKPVENWRREKSDVKDDPNMNRQKNWTRQRSKDNLEDDDDKSKDGERYRSTSRSSRDSKPGNKMNRRNSGDGEANNSNKTPPRRHVSDVPRNNKYWDHDDRCDRDYSS